MSQNFSPAAVVIGALRVNIHSIKNSEYDQEIPQSQTADKPMVLWGRDTQQSQDTRKTNKAIRSLFPIEMIAKLEWTQSNAQQNIDQLQNPTMGVTINNNRTTALERTVAKATGGLSAFYWY